MGSRAGSARHKVQEQRNIRELRLLPQSCLDQHIELAVPDRALKGRLVSGPGIVATAFDLAALHGEIDRGAALIAIHDLELGSEHRVVDRRPDHRGTARPARADDHFVGDGIIESLDARRVPGHGHVVRLGKAAEPFESAERCLQTALSGCLVNQQALTRKCQECPVLRRQHRGMIHRHQPAAARLIDHDEAWAPRNVPAVVSAEQPQIKIIAVAGRPIGRHRYCLAGIKSVGGVRCLSPGDARGRQRHAAELQPHVTVLQFRSASSRHVAARGPTSAPAGQRPHR